MKDRSEATTPPIPPLQFERTENFVSSYANNVAFEASAWDIKLLFGQLDQASGKTSVKQHLAVTIPWPQAKLLLFWLRVQVEAAEASVKAKIPIRKDLIPPELPPPTDKEKNDPDAKEFYELYRKAREEFLASMKE